MLGILKSIRKAEKGFDKKAEVFAVHHPFLAFFAMFVGIPAAILLTVSFATIVIALPAAYLFGWY